MFLTRLKSHHYYILYIHVRLRWDIENDTDIRHVQYEYEWMARLVSARSWYARRKFYGLWHYSSFGGSGIFTNCFGEPNYDAMAGYGVANALLGVAGQAIAANRKEKAPEVNYTQELSKISKEIETKEIDKAEQTDIINTKTDEIKTATDTKTKLTGDLKTAESNLNAYKKELK